MVSEKDTYEFEERNIPLERIEWDDLWYQEADDTTCTRVLLIGDSITRGFRAMANQLLNEAGAVADQLATSKGLDNPFLIPLIDYAVAQQPGCRVIQLCLGHHGGHQSGDEFREDYDRILAHMTAKYPDKKLVIASLTPVRDRTNLNELSARNDRVLVRREMTREMAEKYGLTYVDLYQPLVDRVEFFGPDGIHLLENGYKLLAETCVKIIKTLL